MLPRIVKQIQNDLQVERVSRFGPTDVGIARTPEGTTFVDVLSTKYKPLSDKDIKDYDTLKWEEELRSQLAQKRGQQTRKLTAEEQAKVKAQLAKEAEIRKNVRSEEEVLKRGAGIIESLALGPPVDAERWINPAIKTLSVLARAGAGVIVGPSISTAYVACAEKISARLGHLRPFIGIATLRSFGKTYLSPELEAEPLNSKRPCLYHRIFLLTICPQPL